MASGALTADLRNSTTLKYMVNVSENNIYAEFITKTHHHIEAEKIANLEASILDKTSYSGQNTNWTAKSTILSKMGM